MRRVSLFLTSLFLLNLFIIPANSAVKYGDKCAKAGQTATASGKKFTCIKSGKKLIWNKGVAIPKPVATPTTTPVASSTPTPTPTPTPEAAQPFQFHTFCDLDPDVPDVWKEFQNAIGINRCAPPYRFKTSFLTSEKPKALITDKNNLLPVENCKLKRSEGFQYGVEHNQTLNPNLSVIVVPFTTLDYPTSKDPIEDWKFYFDWIKKSISDMSDVDTNIKFDIGPKYFQISSRMKDFNLGGDVNHGDKSARDRRFALINEILKVADPSINFSNYQFVFFVSPRNVSRDELSNQIASGQQIVTSEKTFYTNGYITSYIDDFKSKYWIEREPFSFIHEMMHVFGTAEDYYGDFDYGGSDKGAGHWGNMSRAATDHFVWDKWTSKLVADEQVLCVSPNQTSIIWIKPSTIKGKYEKLILIRLSEYEAIGVESIRDSGFNYKIPKAQHGAIAYLLNTKLIDDFSIHGDGLKVYCPDNRPCTADQDRKFGGFMLSQAALKPGDSLTLKGVKISVVEAGDFGDVVKVEKL